PWILLDSLGILLGFPWIPSSDSGLFNGLRAIPRTKTLGPLRRRSSPRPSGPAALILPQALSRDLRGLSVPALPCQPCFHFPPRRRRQRKTECHGFRKPSGTKQESLAAAPWR